MASDRYIDLLKQGFLKQRKTKKAATSQEQVACPDCLNWHRKGKHTSNREQRARNRAARAKTPDALEDLSPIAGQPGLFVLDGIDVSRRWMLWAAAGLGAYVLLKPSPVQASASHRQWGPVLDAGAAKAGVSSKLVRAVAWVESRWDPSAVSRVGAIGLMQLMPGTAKQLKVDPYNPAQNAYGGARLLKVLVSQFGQLDKALAAYNWGPNNVLKKPLPSQWPDETQAYVKNVLAIKSRGVV